MRPPAASRGLAPSKRAGCQRCGLRARASDRWRALVADASTVGQDAGAPPKISVVLVHWERAGIADTVECLQSLAETTYPNLSAILVNNGAQTFPSERFLAALPGLKILHSPT